MEKKLMGMVSLVFLAAGCLLGIAGLGSPSWAALPTNHNVTKPNGTLVIHSGLWEECTVDVASMGDVPCQMTLKSDVDAQTEVLRIFIVIGNVCVVVAFVLAVIWVFSSRFEDSYLWRTLVFLFSSLAAFLTLMPSLGFGLKLMIAKDTPYQLSWGFGVAVAGALLLAPANFFLCQFAHKKDDEDNILYEKHTRNQRQMDHHGNTRTSYM